METTESTALATAFDVIFVAPSMTSERQTDAPWSSLRCLSSPTTARANQVRNGTRKGHVMTTAILTLLRNLTPHNPPKWVSPSRKGVDDYAVRHRLLEFLHALFCDLRAAYVQSVELG